LPSLNTAVLTDRLGGVSREPRKLAQASHALAVELDDHIVGAQAGFGGRAVGRDRFDEYAPSNLEPLQFRRLEFPGGDANPRAGALENRQLLEPVPVAPLTASGRGERERGDSRRDGNDQQGRLELHRVPLEESRSSETGEPGQKLVRW
jgi:hypothetical protein